MMRVFAIVLRIHISGKINDKERQYYTFRSAGAPSRPFVYDGWQIVPEQCRMRNNISNKFIQLWEIILVTLRTRLETKIGSDSTPRWGRRVSIVILCLLLNRHSGVTLTRILSPNSGLVLIPYYIKKWLNAVSEWREDNISSWVSLWRLSCCLLTSPRVGHIQTLQVMNTNNCLQPPCSQSAERKEVTHSFRRRRICQAPCPINLQVLTSSQS